MGTSSVYCKVSKAGKYDVLSVTDGKHFEILCIMHMKFGWIELMILKLSTRRREKTSSLHDCVPLVYFVHTNVSLSMIRIKNLHPICPLNYY